MIIVDKEINFFLFNFYALFMFSIGYREDEDVGVEEAPGQFPCRRCISVFPSKEELEDHMEETHCVTCQECGLRLRDTSFARHQRRLHQK